MLNSFHEILPLNILPLIAGDAENYFLLLR